jgi:Ca2+-transporting ATPase
VQQASGRSDEQGGEPAWHLLGAAETVARLGTDAVQGLPEATAAERRVRYGPNTLPERAPRSLAAMFFARFADFMILVLLAAALVSGFIGEPQDTFAILAIVVLNAVVGAVQEYRAERALAARRRLAAPDAPGRRDGALRTVQARDLVPGDWVALEAGNLVPADLRLLESADLQTDESALTGESQPVEKCTAALEDPRLSLGDRRNLAFKGTHVTRGRGAGVVVRTGAATELGRVAGLLEREEAARTPLQDRLARFGRQLALAVLAICAVVFVAGLLQGQPLVLMLLTAVSLAVAAIPEALPAVVAISLALGARKLGRHAALVRNLPAVETLGSVTFICADKTGTLTENRMRVDAAVVAGERRGSLRDAGADPPWQALGLALALCNDVAAQTDGVTGDPTEVALYRFAEEAGLDKAALESTAPRIAEVPFASERKRMATLHRSGDGVVAYVKGAPEAVLPRCREQLTGSGRQPLDPDAALEEAQALADEGYRVLALAQRRFPALPEALEEVESDLTLLGLVALIDPPRPEAAPAVADCLSAGITPVLITGDHPGTALSIARRLGIAGEDDEVLTGAELAELSEAQLARQVTGIRVYARMSPEQKIRIVRALEERDEYVAMTGDGVNDAPALKRAAIGIAMGRKGTDVAREAADMVLLDDDFATIVRAVREGRRIFDNIRKFIKDTMSSNSGEIWTLFLAPFLGLPIPLLPIQILWINLVTDGLPGLAFSAEPAEPGIMRRPPRPPGESIFAHGMWQHIVWVGLFVAGVSIASEAWAWTRGVEHWQTIVFTVLTVSQLFHSLEVRSERASLFQIGLTSNLPMLGAVGLTVALQLAVIYVPLLNPIFKTSPLPPAELALCFGLSSLVGVAVEIEKALVRRGLLYGEPALEV